MSILFSCTKFPNGILKFNYLLFFKALDIADPKIVVKVIFIFYCFYFYIKFKALFQSKSIKNKINPYLKSLKLALKIWCAKLFFELDGKNKIKNIIRRNPAK